MGSPLNLGRPPWAHPLGTVTPLRLWSPRRTGLTAGPESYSPWPCASHSTWHIESGESKNDCQAVIEAVWHQRSQWHPDELCTFSTFYAVTFSSFLLLKRPEQGGGTGGAGSLPRVCRHAPHAPTSRGAVPGAPLQAWPQSGPCLHAPVRFCPPPGCLRAMCPGSISRTDCRICDQAFGRNTRVLLKTSQPGGKSNPFPLLDPGRSSGAGDPRVQEAGR